MSQFVVFLDAEVNYPRSMYNAFWRTGCACNSQKRNRGWTNKLTTGIKDKKRVVKG